MQPLRAHVRKGRLVLDEPTDLPEGEIVELVPLGDAAGLGDAEHAALQRELELSMADAEAGNLIEADQVLAELRARR